MTERPSRGLRISLAGLLCLVVIAAALVHAWLNAARAADTAAANATLRLRLAGLDLDDPSRGYAKLLGDGGYSPHAAWWQVYTPDRVAAVLKLRVGFEVTELPLPGGACTVRFGCTDRDGRWRYQVGVSGAQTKAIHSDLAPPWIDPASWPAGRADTVDWSWSFSGIGDWPNPSQRIGHLVSWDAMTAKNLVCATRRGNQPGQGVVLSIEPLPDPGAVR